MLRAYSLDLSKSNRILGGDLTAMSGPILSISCAVRFKEAFEAVQRDTSKEGEMKLNIS